MPYEIGASSIKVIGYNVPIQFLDPSRNVQAEIFLQADNTLNLGGTTGTPETAADTTTPHALSNTTVHLGTLSNAQAPQFLLLDGSRDMSDDLDMGGNSITDVNLVDGVDVSAHATRHEAGGGDTVNHDSLTGFVADEHIAHSGVTLTAGDGLTGGGTIAASRSFAVGAGDGIDVAADSVAVDVTDILGSGLTESSNNIDLNWGTPTIGTIEPDDAANAGTSTNPARSDHQHAIAAAAPSTNVSVSSSNAEGSGSSFARAAHTHAATSSSNPGAAASLLASSAAGYLTLVRLNTDTIGDRSGGDLTITPTGDLVLNPTGAQVRIAASHTLQANNYASQVTGWGITYGGSADFRYVYTDELHAKAFIADLEQALAGGQIISKSVAILSRDFTAPAAEAATTLYVWDLPSAEDMAVFQSGDIIRLRQFSRAGGSLSITNCWGVVTSYSDLSNKEQSWTFTRSAAPNAGAMAATTVVDADAIVLDYGTDGNGFYEVNAIDGAYAVNSPYSQIVTWATHPATGQTVRTRLGNLYGITAATEYGLFAGDGVTAGDSYLRMTDVNFELHNIDFAMYDDGNVQRIGMDASAGSGDKLMWAGPSSTDPRFIVYGDGTTWLSTLAISENAGQMLFSQADGLLLLSPYSERTPTAWVSTRGQTATISGAFHEVAGPWSSSRALMVEAATTNVIPDPIFGYGDLTYWTQYNGSNVATRSTDIAMFGEAAMKVTGDGANSSGLYRTVTTASGGSWTASAHFYVSTFASGQPTLVCRVIYDDASYDQTAVTANTAKLKQWQRVTATQAANGAKTVASVRVYVYSGAGAGTWYADGVQVENTAFATSFAWGGMGSGYAWASTVNGSATTRAATEVNMDAYAGMFSGMSTLSFSAWIQAPYDADALGEWASGYPRVFSLYYDASNRISLRYNATGTGYFYLVVNGTALATGFTALSFLAGDWLHVIATLDFTNDEYYVYVNGAQTIADTTSLSAPTGLNQMNVGADYDGTSPWGGAIAEFASFGRVLTAEEIANIYAGGRPLADMGAFKNPGIYVLDGGFRLASSTAGIRSELSAPGLGVYDDSGTTSVGRVLVGLVDSSTGVLDIGGDVLGAFGYDDADALQVAWYASGANAGKVVAGGGDVVLDEDGVTLSADTAYAFNAKSIKWYSGSDIVGNVACYIDGSSIRNTLIETHDEDHDAITRTYIMAGNLSYDYAQIFVKADNTTGNLAQIALSVTSGANLSLYDTASPYVAINYCDLRIAQGALSVGTAVYYMDQPGILIEGIATTPTAPAASDRPHIYVRNGNLVIQYYDSGTVRYKYLGLSGTGTTWTHSTTPP